MSKIGKKPIAIPEGIQIKVVDGFVTVKGPMGEEQVSLIPEIVIEQSEERLSVNVKDPENAKQRALWGTYRALLANAIRGVGEGFERKLEINGVGYRAEVKGKILVLNVGYSHSVELSIPEGLETKVEKNTITVTGTSKQRVGQFAAIIREVRKPEPYKGKGIKYDDEVVRRKAGKVVKAAGG